MKHWSILMMLLTVGFFAVGCSEPAEEKSATEAQSLQDDPDYEKEMLGAGGGNSDKNK